MVESNDDRADLAQIALDAFIGIAYGSYDTETQETCFSDLMIDMRHLADRLGIDWHSMIQSVDENYEEEIEEFPKCEPAEVE